jgi:hypothetical protein
MKTSHSRKQLDKVDRAIQCLVILALHAINNTCVQILALHASSGILALRTPILAHLTAGILALRTHHLTSGILALQTPINMLLTPGILALQTPIGLPRILTRLRIGITVHVNVDALNQTIAQFGLGVCYDRH